MTYQEAQERQIQEKQKRLERMKKRWEEDKTPFVKAYEVPDLPIVDTVEWKTFRPHRRRAARPRAKRAG